jgi:hypothetical protein
LSTLNNELVYATTSLFGSFLPDGPKHRNGNHHDHSGGYRNHYRKTRHDITYTLPVLPLERTRRRSGEHHPSNKLYACLVENSSATSLDVNQVNGWSKIRRPMTMPANKTPAAAWRAIDPKATSTYANIIRRFLVQCFGQPALVTATVLKVRQSSTVFGENCLRILARRPTDYLKYPFSGSLAYRNVKNHLRLQRHAELNPPVFTSILVWEGTMGRSGT